MTQRSGWQCPYCKVFYDAGTYPDHWGCDMRGNIFEFECSCNATFEVDVDWEPDFCVRKSSLVPPKESAASDD